MARDEDSDRKRRREREDESEKEDLERQRKKGIQTKKDGTDEPALGDASLDNLIGRSEILIEQIDHLYGMYFQGIERLPPREKRNLLDSTIKQIEQDSKMTLHAKFKSQALLTKYGLYRDRWDKRLRDLEDGKIKRIK